MSGPNASGSRRSFVKVDQYGIFGESEWSRFENAICTFHGLLTTVPRIQVEEVLTDEFKDFAAGLCAG